MHKVKSTHTIINIIHLILWIWSFQTYQHPRSNDINEVEEVGSQNKHKKKAKNTFCLTGNRFTSVGNRFPECRVQIWRKKQSGNRFPSVGNRFPAHSFQKNSIMNFET